MNITSSKSFLIVAIALLLSGCAIHGGYMNASASLSSSNFEYVSRNVQGSATATYVIGIGGLARQSLINDAKEALLANTPLKENQALANVTVNYKNSFYLGVLVRTTKCIVTADIVEFK